MHNKYIQILKHCQASLACCHRLYLCMHACMSPPTDSQSLRTKFLSRRQVQTLANKTQYIFTVALKYHYRNALWKFTEVVCI